MSTHHPIAVIGVGLGGLTFAHVLHRNGIDATVYELEPSATARQQGVMLDITGDTKYIPVTRISRREGSYADC